jgi:hypothetical protein
MTQIFGSLMLATECPALAISLEQMLIFSMSLCMPPLIIVLSLLLESISLTVLKKIANFV